MVRNKAILWPKVNPPKSVTQNVLPGLQWIRDSMITKTRESYIYSYILHNVSLLMTSGLVHILTRIVPLYGGRGKGWPMAAFPFRTLDVLYRVLCLGHNPPYVLRLLRVWCCGGVTSQILRLLWLIGVWKWFCSHRTGNARLLWPPCLWCTESHAENPTAKARSTYWRCAFAVPSTCVRRATGHVSVRRCACLYLSGTAPVRWMHHSRASHARTYPPCPEYIKRANHRYTWKMYLQHY